MATKLIFNDCIEYEPGIICRLLSECHREILDEQLERRFELFDSDVFENPQTIGKCTFITTLGSDVVGMASFDPRQAPQLGIIGYNCISPEHQGKGYGKQQILEVIRRLKAIGAKCVSVSTSGHPFFEPASLMYLSCGFSESKRRQRCVSDPYKIIYYEMKLK
jgi:GNAT superfamily N-acetyltransferase